MRESSQIRVIACLTVGFVLTLPGGGLGPAAQEAPKRDEGTKHLDRMRAMAQSVRIAVEGSGAPEVTAEPAPAVRYNDQPRHIEDATLWLFGHGGRPVAAMKIELYPREVGLYGLVSLAPGTIAAKADDGWRWASTQPGLRMAPLPDAPVPAQSERERLVQMKALVRRFSGTEDDGPVHGKLSLRLLSKPIHRYTDAAAGIDDGAIFGLAIGTNPDILIVIEATRAAGASAPAWRYGLARTGGADLFVSLDGRAIWSVPIAPIPARRETYINRYVNEAPSNP